MPDPVPVPIRGMILARLSVDVRMQGIKLGSALLKNAILRLKTVRENVGVRALNSHTLNESRKKNFMNITAF